MGLTTSPLDDDRRRAILRDLLGTSDLRSKTESEKYGKSLRKAVPRDVFAAWHPPVGRPDPVDLLLGQDAMRVQSLVHIRHERMSASAHAFYRGAALVMASDLSSLPTTGIEVQACGDAHVGNFGLFLSPERRTVFDINDFDETARAPWEWDVARLAASVEICGRDRGFSAKKRQRAVLAAVRAYREAMRGFAQMGNLDVWYAHLDVDSLAARIREADTPARDPKARKKARKRLEKSKQKNSVKAAGAFTEVVDGVLRVKSDPPLIVPLRDFVEINDAEVSADALMAKAVSTILDRYRESLPPERAALMSRYRPVDAAHKVVGTGSVGMRTWIAVFEGAGIDDPLVLQIKEASSSVLERFAGKAPQENHGQRVVEGQHAMQTASDVLLGWTRLPGTDGAVHDYYVRQLWDGKGSIDLDGISAESLRLVATACGWTLAHAHARTGDRFAIGSYLGKSDRFDNAMLRFATLYANQNEQDYAAFLERTIAR